MAWYSRFRVTGLTLSSVNTRLSALRESLPTPLKLTSTYVPHEACVDVYLLPDAQHPGTLPLDEERMLKLSQRIEHLLGAEEFVFHSHHAWPREGKFPAQPYDPDAAPTLSSAVLDLLKQHGGTLASAESLTGGLLASALTDVPGASAHFVGGVVAYSAHAKYALGVPRTTVAMHGIVSPQTATALATAVKKLYGADIGVGVTGVAGPAEHGGRPVGTVFVGVDGPRGVVVEEGGEVCMEREARREMKAAAVAAALNLLRRQLKSPAAAE